MEECQIDHQTRKDNEKLAEITAKYRDMRDKYLESLSEKGKMQRKITKMMSKHYKKEAKYWDKELAAKKDMKELETKNEELLKKLKASNTELLLLGKHQTHRGLIEWFEKKTFPSVHFADITRRSMKWQIIFELCGEFRRKLTSLIGWRVTHSHVYRLIKNIYRNRNSEDVCYSDLRKEFRIPSSYSREEQKLLAAICECIPCTFSVQGF